MTASEPRASAIATAYSPIDPAPAPPTTSTGAPGSSSRAGPTVRQASLMLSEALATAAASSSSGTATSM